MIKSEIDRRVNGETKIMGVLGNPIEHSISPQIHNTISKLLCVNSIYVPFLCSQEDLEKAVNGLRALNIYGFNVTIPYKEKIISLLDECSEEVKLIGAANTVVNKKGRLIGYNTDGDGFATSFENSTNKSFVDKDIIVLGAGGAARATALKTAKMGAKTITLVNRTVIKAAEIADMINNNTSCKAVPVSNSDKNLAKLLEKSDIIINTTPVGMHPDTNKCPIQEDITFSSRQIVYDLIYNPSETLLLKKARKEGALTINGLGMLIYQATLAYEIINEIDIPEQILKKIFLSFTNFDK